MSKKITFRIFLLCIISLLMIPLNIIPRRTVRASTKLQDASLGALHVEGTLLKSEDGDIVQLRGVSTHGLSWFPEYVNSKCFNELHDKWKANVVRLAMYTEEYNGYCNSGTSNQKNLRKLVSKGVKLATKHDMYVIIDWHLLSDENPKTHIKEAKSFFKKMAHEFADNTNVLYEICNEPNGGTSWKDIKSYAKEIIKVIRKEDKDSVIIVGTPNWSQKVNEAMADPLEEKNIMYSLHFYANTHKSDLRKTAKDAIDAGLPIFVTEFGICDSSGAGTINETEANAWIKLLDKKHVSYVGWNLSNKDETCALINSSCKKTYGFTRKNLSPSGKWLFNLLRKKAQ